RHTVRPRGRGPGAGLALDGARHPPAAAPPRAGAGRAPGHARADPPRPGPRRLGQREPHRRPAPGHGAVRVRDAEGPAEGRPRRRGGRVSTPPTPGERFPTCLVVDFGAQYAQLIARRVREAHGYSEIVPHSITAAEVRARRPAAIVLSGGPRSVHVEGAPRLDPEIYELGVPILGICYGAQLVAQQLGGEVARGGTGEYGRTELTVTDGSGLFADQPVHQTVWMSHFDGITRVPEGFRATATTDGAPVAALESPERRIWAVQHHPEVSHTPFGQQLLRHFLHHLAGIPPTWTMTSIIEQQVEAIRAQVGDARVIC